MQKRLLTQVTLYSIQNTIFDSGCVYQAIMFASQCEFYRLNYVEFVTPFASVNMPAEQLSLNNVGTKGLWSNKRTKWAFNPRDPVIVMP